MLSCLGLSQPLLDKQHEQAALSNERAQLLARLSAAEVSAADRFAVAILCLVAKHLGKLVRGTRHCLSRAYL